MYVFGDFERNAKEHIWRRSKYGALKYPPQTACNAVHVQQSNARVECKKLSGMLFVRCLVRFHGVDNDAMGRGAVRLCGHSVDKRNN